MDDFATRAARARHVTMVHERRPVEGPSEGPPEGPREEPREGPREAPERPLAEFRLVRIRSALVPASARRSARESADPQNGWIDDEDDGFGLA